MKYYNVSVIVAVFNAEKTIEKTIDSLFNQKLEKLEIILINDGSTDKSLDIIKRKKKNMPRSDINFVIIDRENKGIAFTRQEGIDCAKGEYIIHLDSDDYASDLWLSELYKKATSTKCDIVICDYFHCLNGNKTQITNIEANNNYQYIELILSGEIGGFSWNKLIKNDFVRKMNINFQGFCYGEDLAFYINALKLNPKVEHVHIPLVYYNLDSYSSITREINYKKIGMVNELIIYLEELLKFEFEQNKISPDKMLLFKLRQKSWFIQCFHGYVPNYVWELYPEESKRIKEVRMPRYIKWSIFLATKKKLRFISRLIVKLRHALK